MRNVPAFDFDWDYRSDVDQMAGGLGIPVSKKNVDTPGYVSQWFLCYNKPQCLTMTTT